MQRIMELDLSRLTPILAAALIALGLLGAVVWDIAKGILGNLLTPLAERIVFRVRDDIAQRSLEGARKEILRIHEMVLIHSHLADDQRSFVHYAFYRLFGAIRLLAFPLAISALVQRESNFFYSGATAVMFLMAAWSITTATNTIKNVTWLDSYKSNQRERVSKLVAKYPDLQALADEHKF